MLWKCYNSFKASFLLRSQGTCPVNFRYLSEVMNALLIHIYRIDKGIHAGTTK